MLAAGYDPSDVHTSLSLHTNMVKHLREKSSKEAKPVSHFSTIEVPNPLPQPVSHVHPFQSEIIIIVSDKLQVENVFQTWG